MKLREKIDSFLEKALILIMSLMVVNVLWQVFSRYLLTNPSSFTDELARYLMIWVERADCTRDLPGQAAPDRNREN